MENAADKIKDRVADMLADALTACIDADSANTARHLTNALTIALMRVAEARDYSALDVMRYQVHTVLHFVRVTLAQSIAMAELNGVSDHDDLRHALTELIAADMNKCIMDAAEVAAEMVAAAKKAGH